jgi:hypothetical protein
MALPPALLQLVEQHGCFTGCYGFNSNVEVFTSPTAPPVPMFSVSCMDCLAHFGVLGSLLPKSMNKYQLADQLSEHVRVRRGYSLSVSGYNAKGPGFWFSAVYWASCNVFLLDAERSRQLGSDLDLLMLAFQHGVLKAPTPEMLKPASFAVQPVYYDVRQPMPAVSAKADLLTAPGISLQPVTGWKKLTLAEFVGAVPGSAQAAPSIVSAVPAAPGIGQRCPKCGAEVRQRTLLYETFVGCLC